MFTNLLLKKMMASQLGKLPAEYRAKIEALIDKDPQALIAMAQDVQKEMQSGKSQEEALKAIAEKYGDTIKALQS